MTFDIFRTNHVREPNLDVRPARYANRKARQDCEFPDGTSRSGKAMKRLRGTVAAVPKDVWTAYLATVSRKVPNDEFVRLETWLRTAQKRERCTIRFAFGLALRHSATRRYREERDAVERTVGDIVRSGTLVGILLVDTD